MAIAKPEPYKDTDFEKFWQGEDFDRYLPSPGFITDFILTLRGVENPTIFGVWSSIFLLSSLVKREAWLEWFPEPIYPNFYILLVAPPRACAKSTGISYATMLLQGYPLLLPMHLKYLKIPNIVSTRATPESLSDAMVAQEYKYVDNNEIKTLHRGSEIAIVASEASTFLGKQKYNVGLIDKLTHLYDCRSHDQDRTRKTGLMLFENTYVTFIGATTPEGVRQTIPEEAFEGGFMSRLIVVWQAKSTRSYPEPRPVGPSRTDLETRLAWIAENAQGKYALSPEAKKTHDEWYEGFHRSIEAKEGSERHKAMFYRFDIHLLKLALLLRIQRYQKGNVIELQDYLEAKTLLDATIGLAHSPVEDVGSSPYGKFYNRIKKLVSEGPKPRMALLQAMSPYECTASDVTNIINNLAEEGQVEIILNGKRETSASKNGKEVYSWVKDSTISK